MSSNRIILLVDDNPNDLELALEALKELKLKHEIYAVSDGLSALDFLTHNSFRSSQMPRPDCVLLDLNLPKMNGKEVLRKVKIMPSLRSIPVIIFTNSDDPKDVMDCYTLYANCYVKKPTNFEDFLEIVKQIDIFWFNMITLPGKSNGQKL